MRKLYGWGDAWLSGDTPYTVLLHFPFLNYLLRLCRLGEGEGSHRSNWS